jgi:5-(carboxyamino)imidazole ribonucleotide synthase
MEQASMITSLSPGHVIGIIGGGQLGRMTALAAAQLGYVCHIFCPEKDAPALDVVSRKTIASYEDHKALTEFAKQIDLVTFEFENIPVTSIQLLEQHGLVRPSSKILEISQNRILEKTFLNDLSIQTAPWYGVQSLSDLKNALQKCGLPSVLKTAKMGYDGKGQVKITDSEPKSLAKIWKNMKSDLAILESWIPYTCEVSCLIARDINGHSDCYDIAENEHKNHILYRTIVPARIDPLLTAKIRGIATKIAEALHLVGLLAIEFFITHEGKILVNEIAPRPHNSGHWTLDACSINQFEQFIRAVCGLPLGKTERHSDAEMLNLIGDDVEKWPDYLKDSHCNLHLYGKNESRPGRKMGHVTWLKKRSYDREL